MRMLLLLLKGRVGELEEGHKIFFLIKIKKGISLKTWPCVFLMTKNASHSLIVVPFWRASRHAKSRDRANFPPIHTVLNLVNSESKRPFYTNLGILAIFYAF